MKKSDFIQSVLALPKATCAWNRLIIISLLTLLFSFLAPLNAASRGWDIKTLTVDGNEGIDIADFNNDEIVDLVGTEVTKPSNITGVILRSYTNFDLVENANCFSTEDPANPNGCAFYSQQAVDLSSWTNNQWIFRNSKSAIDINADGNKDLAIL